MKQLITLATLLLGLSTIGIGQIEEFYQYVESNLESYDSAGFYFVKIPNAIPPQGFFDMYKLQSGDVDNDIELEKTWTDESLQMTHYRYQQTYKGLWVELAELTEHFKGNELRYVNGKITAGLDQVNTTPSISPEDAITIVQNNYNSTSSQTNTINASSSSVIGTPLLILAIDNYNDLSAILDGERYVLAWKIHFFDSIQDINVNVYVNALNGLIFREDSNKSHGSASIWYHGNQNIDTDWFSPLFRYRLVAGDNGRDFTTMQEGNSSIPHDNDDNWGTNWHEQTAAHWGVMKSWDYFKNTHNWNGMDGKGTKMFVIVGGTGNDARYEYNQDHNGYDQLIFTTGQNQYYNRAIDIVGHEFSHGFLKYTADFGGSGEPGILKEAFADIFGCLIETYAEGTPSDWHMGEDPNLAKQRSLKDPKSSGEHLTNGTNTLSPGQPDTYHGDNWYFGNWDYGGVHFNGGVLGYWFYLLSEGGNGINDNNDNYSIQGLGLNKATQITAWMVRQDLQTGATFWDTRVSSINYVRDTYGICSNEDIQTTNAWQAVGVGDGTTCAVNSIKKAGNYQDFSIFPNPSDGIFTISNIGNQIDKIEVLSLTGKTVYSNQTQNLNQYILDLSSLLPGVYIVEIKTNDYIARKRIIISK